MVSSARFEFTILEFNLYLTKFREQKIAIIYIAQKFQYVNIFFNFCVA